MKTCLLESIISYYRVIISVSTCFFSLPDEMGISSKTLTEEQYFHHSIQNHSAYYSDQLHVPLVRSRFISQKKGEQSDYRLNLNLYSYQIRTALDTDVKQTLKIKDSKTFYPQAIVLAEQTSALLKNLGATPLLTKNSGRILRMPIII